MAEVHPVAVERQGRYVSTLEQLLAFPSTDIRSALDQASQLVSETLAADKVDTFLYEPTTSTLVAGGTSDTPLGRRQKELGLDRMALANGGSSVQVFQTGTPYHTGHADEDPNELRGLTHALGIRSIAAVALDVDGTRRGVIQVASAQPDQFSAEDLAFVEAVGRWVGMVLHRAELVERSRLDAADQAHRMAAEELATILAHDLRGPLTPLRGYLGMIRGEVERAGLTAAVRYATASERVVERMSGMIGNLLDAARLENGIFALERQVVDVARLARESARLLATPEIPIAVRGPEVALVDGDPERIRQVLENLLANACKHAPAGTEISVDVAAELRGDRAWTVLSVHDAGPGIAPELLPRLFTRFARGDGSRGLGLGLYLARGIAEAHGGTLAVDSRPGKGATFHLALPEANGPHR